RQGLALAAVERGSELVPAFDHAHTAPAAAGSRLEHDGIAKLVGHRSRLLRRRQRLRAAPDDRDVQRAGQLPRLSLVSEEGQGFGLGTNKTDALLGAAPGESRVLRQDSVAGMDAVAAGVLRRLDQAFDVEVGAHRIAFGAYGAGLGGDAGV